jgi:peptidoglycan/xylan/chitin deacetylase (PgdA/CDA1 family)
VKRLGVARTIFELVAVAAIVLLATNRPRPGTWPRWREAVIYSVPTQQKVVALTYDDGPHPVYTRLILDILDKYNVKATFFMVGKNMQAYPDIVREVVSRGHAIGNHTYTHPRNLELDTQAQLVREMDRCEEVIERLTGSRAHLFRPPRGLVDGSVFTIATEEGYTTILWSVCADHHDATTPKLMAQRVLKHSRRGGIILVHDGSLGSRWKDVAATPLVIEDLRKRGYRFVTVPELLNMR